MAFIDEINLHIKAGKGGDGVVRWRHEKNKEWSGPSGGNGGKGADVYVIGVRDIGALTKFRNVKELNADNGGDGMKDSKHGENGEDLVIELPIGSVITNKDSKFSIELTKEGEKRLILSGGRGGVGNEFFKSSKNTTPKESTPGVVGEEADFYVELQLIADAGLIGLPNAGKSSLLNSLTKSKAKIGSYQFTTLEPNLGNMYGFILADIPGLIEGASEGKGLGHKFLRHIRRTRFLIHCISLESDDMERDYKVIRGELKAYAKELAEKPEIIVLTKTDVTDEKILKKQIAVVKKFSKNTLDFLSVSVLDDEAVKKLLDDLVRLLKR